MSSEINKLLFAMRNEAARLLEARPSLERLELSEYLAPSVSATVVVSQRQKGDFTYREGGLNFFARATVYGAHGIKQAERWSRGKSFEDVLVGLAGEIEDAWPESAQKEA